MSVERLNELVRQAAAARADLEDAKQAVDAATEDQRAASKAAWEAGVAVQEYLDGEYAAEVLNSAQGMEYRQVV